MQFQVPQNIAMEDKIIGPFTAIQFGILLVGGGLAFLVYSSQTIPSPINLIGGAFLGLFTIVMAIGKFNDQPMYRAIRFLIGFIFSPKVRVWHKKGIGEEQLIKAAQEDDSNKQKQSTKHVTREDIARLSSVVDTRGKQGTIPDSLLPKQPTKK